jgi:DnaJ-domain-containing protein 1
MITQEEFMKIIIFQFFDEIEHYEINKGFSKATLKDLMRLYENAYKAGADDALTDAEELITNLNKKYWEKK